MCVFEEGFGGAETDELRKINKYICGLGAMFECSLTRSHPNHAPRPQICFIYLPEFCLFTESELNQ